MTKKEVFSSDNEGLLKAVDCVEKNLVSCKIKGKELRRAILTAEEAFASLIEQADEDSTVSMKLRSFQGNVSIEFISHGKEFDPVSSMDKFTSIDVDDTEAGNVSQNAIRSILLNAFTDRIRYDHRNGVNRIKMRAVKSRQSFLWQTLGAMIVAILVGFIFSRFAPEVFNKGLNTYCLVPVKTMYMNALKMCVAPVVFFSIISCVVQFSDLRELGRIGGKVFFSYLFTTVVAVGVGLGVYFLMQPGGAMATSAAADVASVTSKIEDISILDTIINIVPSDIISPFLQSNMLQLIFMAILAGVAVGMIGQYSHMLREIIGACNDLFLMIITLIIRVMPIAVFCSMCSMMLELGIDTIISVMGMFGTFLVGLLCMMLVYCLILAVFGRMNPITFIKKYAPTMLQVFSTASSNASIPLNMQACEKKLGISASVYSLSIPLGATINMDGTCIHLAVFSLALAKVYGVDISGAAILSLVVSIIVLSMGAPGIPGSGLICLSVILTQIGVPIEAIGIVMGVDSLAGMFRTMSNCLGDVAITTVVAKSEKKIDMDIYMG